MALLASQSINDINILFKRVSVDGCNYSTSLDYTSIPALSSFYNWSIKTNFSEKAVIMSTRSFQKPVFLKELKEWPFNGRSSWNRVRYVPYLENFYNIPQKLTLKSRFQSSLLPYTGISCKENIYKLKKWPRESV
jgi:hypothetical protein